MRLKRELPGRLEMYLVQSSYRKVENGEMGRKKTVSYQEKNYKSLSSFRMCSATRLPRERQAADGRPGIWKALQAIPQPDPQQGEKWAATSDVP